MDIPGEHSTFLVNIPTVSSWASPAGGRCKHGLIPCIPAIPGVLGTFPSIPELFLLEPPPRPLLPPTVGCGGSAPSRTKALPQKLFKKHLKKIFFQKHSLQTTGIVCRGGKQSWGCSSGHGDKGRAQPWQSWLFRGARFPALL